MRFIFMLLLTFSIVNVGHSQGMVTIQVVHDTSDGDRLQITIKMRSSMFRL